MYRAAVQCASGLSVSMRTRQALGRALARNAGGGSEGAGGEELLKGVSMDVYD